MLYCVQHYTWMMAYHGRQSHLVTFQIVNAPQWDPERTKIYFRHFFSRLESFFKWTAWEMDQLSIDAFLGSDLWEAVIMPRVLAFHANNSAWEPTALLALDRFPSWWQSCANNSLLHSPSFYSETHTTSTVPTIMEATCKWLKCTLQKI